ncbi:MAG: bifunctional 4-hydroxy-2-oxoglutarate aldolase/2-dehydro-3-deoxy-phosphogluconate aldolase [Bacteroidia bacterium]|jgi:2-dehydro-3-deoxyphosphogluconate aldolase/(4S)-4-hydroxy-2-oxoglutarate aldolase|nr:bifunctional 4-hydroxy-2-oxoglutarate aldolase/2-dehydro-3-deoxy-phosphogluconate aldolase [Bacteroidia bacterium]
MARFSRHEVYQKLYDTRLMPLFFDPDPARVIALAEACYAGGVRALEMTNRAEGAHEVFGALIRHARRHMPDLAVGVGTIVDGATATLFLQIGADFVVTPCFFEDIARMCNRRQVGFLPGCSTSTEIAQAQELGAEFIKVFPAEVLGPKFIQALLGPMPWSRLLPTGGVEPTEASLRTWFEAGAAAVGMGSRLFPKGASPEAISQTVQFVLDTIRSHTTPAHGH